MAVLDKFWLLVILMIIIFISFIGCSGIPIVTPPLDTSGYNRPASNPIRSVQPTTANPSPTNSPTTSSDNQIPNNTTLPRTERTPFQ